MHIIGKMNQSPRNQIIPLALLSAMCALLAKELLTPIVLLGRTYSGRSTLVQIGLTTVFAAVFFLINWTLLPWISPRLSMIKLNEKQFLLIILAATVAIMSKELFLPGMMSGYDIDYHMLRIESLSAGMRHGQIPVRVNPVFLNGYGYASSLFYPDLFLYFPALLRTFGLSTMLSAKIFFVCIFALSFLSSYWVVKEMSGSAYAGTQSAIVYCLSQYLLQNVYRRGAVGEVQATVFLPLIAYGLYSLVFRHFEKHWVIALGLIGLLYSHLISALIAVILSVAIGLLHARAILSDKTRVVRMVKFALITLGGTIAMWLPLVEQFSTGSFKFSQSTYLARYSAVPFSALLAVTGKFSGTYVAFGLPTLLLCLSWFIFQKGEDKTLQQHLVAWGLGSGLVLLLTATDVFPWDWVDGPLNIIQFPWRLYSFAALFLAIAIGVMLNSIIKPAWRRAGAIALIAFLGIHAMWVINVSGSQPRDLPDDFYLRAENTFLVNNGEWLPASTKLDALIEATTDVVNENGEKIDFTREGQEFVIALSDGCTYLDLPILYYKGYSATYKSVEGDISALDILPVLPDYTVRVTCPTASRGGEIEVKYRGTAVQHASLAANLVFTGLIVIMHRYKRDWLL